MEIIMIRHFQTPGNVEKRYIGRTDEPLADLKGREQLIRERQDSCRDVEQVIISPMKRCIQTAACIFPDKTPVLCEKMRECDFGLFEMKRYEELKEIPAYQEWLDSNGTIPFPEGEDPKLFRQRCVEGFYECVDRLISEEVKKAAMVVHGGTIMAVLSCIDKEKREFYHWQLENGGGYRVALDEEAWRQGSRVSGEIEKL
ncbi:histidine phosphatase family protein [Muricomes sp. OA1]|uniref:Histidine phosphatase family protein n=1 Tax=Hungatella hathewayi TaxID=154046 RepID=A0A3E2WZ96_9FIRM|nr:MULTISPECIES: histidine phosphatase family protein [Clostridia]MCH1974478.1 histidine phosphatase family protein [Muricomes sp. OA1]RGC32919.1 histidine phosphatase family protein [Hungatella hathewayi]GKH33256.1 alpha-ribazole phosphatase [Faecalicatena contorta]